MKLPHTVSRKAILALLLLFLVVVSVAVYKSVTFTSLYKVRERIRVVENRVLSFLSEHNSSSASELESFIGQFPEINYLKPEANLEKVPVLNKPLVKEPHGLNGTSWMIDGRHYPPGFYVVVDLDAKGVVRSWTVVAVDSGGGGFTGGGTFVFDRSASKWATTQ